MLHADKRRRDRRTDQTNGANSVAAFRKFCKRARSATVNQNEFFFSEIDFGRRYYSDRLIRYKPLKICQTVRITCTGCVGVCMWGFVIVCVCMCGFCNCVGVCMWGFVIVWVCVCGVL
jgi:hypothetical protein